MKKLSKTEFIFNCVCLALIVFLFIVTFIPLKFYGQIPVSPWTLVLNGGSSIFGVVFFILFMLVLVAGFFTFMLNFFYNNKYVDDFNVLLGIILFLLWTFFSLAFMKDPQMVLTVTEAFAVFLYMGPMVIIGVGVGFQYMSRK